MTTTQRAERLNDLLKRCWEAAQEAKYANGYFCLNLKYAKLLAALNKQIELVLTEVSETL